MDIHLINLPVELLLRITTYLDTPGLAYLSQTCKFSKLALQTTLLKAAKAYALAPTPTKDNEDNDSLPAPTNGQFAGEEWVYAIPRQPLISAILKNRPNAVKGFLEAGVDPNSHDLSGTPLLVLAVQHSRHEIVALLLAFGANPTLPAPGNMASTPLRIAACNRDTRMVSQLISTSKVKIRLETHYIWAILSFCTVDTIKLMMHHGAELDKPRRESNETFLHAAMWNPHPDVLHFLLDKFPHLTHTLTKRRNETILWEAVDAEREDYTAILVAAGVPLNHRSARNETVLHHACSVNNLAGVGGGGKRVAIAKFLIHSGIDVGIPGEDDHTELHYAVKTKCTELVRLLLSRETVKVDAVTGMRRESALHVAADWGLVEMVEMLVEVGGADVRLQDHLGRTAGDIARGRGYGRIEQYLVKREGV